MLRYASVDFRDKSKWNCNGRVNPMMQHTYDGHDLHPLEVRAVGMRVASGRESGTSSAGRAGGWCWKEALGCSSSLMPSRLVPAGRSAGLESWHNTTLHAWC